MKIVYQAHELAADGPGVDVLAFGAHPDDVEIGAAGLLALQVRLGRRVIVADLTAGELSSRGESSLRASEATRAAQLLGLTARIQFGWPDGALEDSPANGRAVARLIRRFRPWLVLAPYDRDRHPDHRATGQIVRRSWFLSRLRQLDLGFQFHAPAMLWFYAIHTPFDPTAVVNISEVMDIRMSAAGAFTSQFTESLSAIPGYQPIGTPDYLPFIEARCRHFGAMIGCQFGEGFLSDGPLAISDPQALLSSATARSSGHGGVGKC